MLSRYGSKVESHDDYREFNWNLPYHKIISTSTLFYLCPRLFFADWIPGWETPFTLGMCEPDCLGCHGQGGGCHPEGHSSDSRTVSAAVKIDNNYCIFCSLVSTYASGFIHCQPTFTASFYRKVFTSSSERHLYPESNNFFQNIRSKNYLRNLKCWLILSLTILGLKISFAVYWVLNLC